MYDTWRRPVGPVMRGVLVAAVLGCGVLLLLTGCNREAGGGGTSANGESRWPLLVGLVLLFGAIGGVLNALVTDNGFFLPAKQDVEGRRLWRPGFVGNIIAGAGAALVSWGMYGPLSAEVIVPLYKAAPPVAAPFGTPGAPALPPAAAAPTTPNPRPGLSLAGLVGALLVGVGGARWLTNEVDKTLLRVAGSVAASRPATPGGAEALLLLSPAEALRSCVASPSPSNPRSPSPASTGSAPPPADPPR